MKNTKIIIIKALEYCDDALTFTEGMDRDAFLHDNKSKAAASMMVIQIGEMCGRLSDDFRAKFPDMKWRTIKDIRNRITHGYGDINFGRVWNILKQDVPTIKTFFEERLRNYELENPEPPKRGPDIPL